MRNGFRSSMIVMVAIGVLAVLSLTLKSTAGQTPAYKAPRTGDGKPNLNGVWQALTTANWDIQAHTAQPGAFPRLLGAMGAVPPGPGVVEGNEIPYQPWAAAKKKENLEKRMMMDPLDLTVGDPEAKCYMPGVPRATYMPFPFQIIQGTDKILIAYEFAKADRIIHMDKVRPSPVDTWMGHSVGRWEGESLVVDVTSLIDQTWFDRAGNFHSDALHVVERYTPISPDALNYEATIEDPKVFTRPWKISLPLYRHLEKNAEINEFDCVEFAEPYMYSSISKLPSK